jgi:hypothetical protein
MLFVELYLNLDPLNSRCYTPLNVFLTRATYDLLDTLDSLDTTLARHDLGTTR